MLRSSLLFSAGLLSIVSSSAFALADVTVINGLPSDQANVSVSLGSSIVGVRDRVTKGIDIIATAISANVCNDTSCQSFRIEDAHLPCTLDSKKYDLHGLSMPSAWQFNFYVNGNSFGSICAPLSDEFISMVHTKLYIDAKTNWGSTTYTATFTAGFFGDDTVVTYSW